VWFEEGHVEDLIGRSGNDLRSRCRRYRVRFVVGEAMVTD
jgi:hypothetical protein